MKLLLSVTLAATYGISMRLLFVSFGNDLAVMSLSFFVIVPFIIGYLTIFLLPYRDRSTMTGAFFTPWITCLVILCITSLTKLEGMICWVMAFPFFGIVAGFGGMLAFGRKRRRALKEVEWDFDKDDAGRPNTLKVSLLFFIPLFAGLLEGNRITAFEELTIEKHLEIAATPQVIWKALTSPHQSVLPSSHPTLCTLMGFPRHLSTTLDTLAINSHRIAVYEKGLTFEETIRRLEPARQLEVTITNDPERISKAIMDDHIVIGGEHIRMQGDTYTLEPLSGGKTRLSLVSHFSINTPFNWYAGLWAKWLMSDVIQEELNSVRQQCTH
ncbi:MAG TPA: hypothetical protein VGS79_15030 [Puia sp.]|nr:hypothetical protein [Puia sp.]